jgi:hypothetical protein
MAAKNSQPDWRTSTWCDSGSCVEVLITNTVVQMRHAGDPGGPVLTFERTAWREFINALREGAVAG